MTKTSGRAHARHRAVIIGLGAAGIEIGTRLLAADMTDLLILEKSRKTPPPRFGGVLRLGCEVVSAVFDDDTDTWALGTTDGQTVRSHVVVATHQPAHIPWIPDVAGRADFRGESFHAAAWNPDFDPAGKRVAVVGGDATSAHQLAGLAEAATSVAVFAHPPRRLVSEVPLPTTRAKRWLRRRTRRERPRPALVRSAIEAVTSSGIRTRDGVNHHADAIIYGTGFTIPDHLPDRALVGTRGLTIRQAWHNGMEPFLGLAVHGVPNYFFVAGPNSGSQARYVVEFLDLIKHTAATRIEVRRSSQHVFNERTQLQPVLLDPVARVSEAFDLSSETVNDDIYDGVATLIWAGSRRRVRVRLAGHLNPIDGNYHWQGTVFDHLPEDALRREHTATLTVGERSAPIRILERTPLGARSVAGVGAPPYHRRTER